MQLCIIRTYVLPFESIRNDNENKNSEDRTQLAAREKLALKNRKSVKTPFSHLILISNLKNSGLITSRFLLQ